MISSTSSYTSYPSCVSILRMMGISGSSSAPYRCGRLDTLSKIVAMARRHPTEASAPLQSSSSRSSPSSHSFQNAAARLVVSPWAYGAISSPNFSTMASSVNTRSSLSTSFISLKNASSSCGRMGRSCSMSLDASTKDPSAITASTRTGRSGSARHPTTLEKRLMKCCGLVNSISAYTPAHHAALARTWPCWLWNAGSTCAASMGSICSLYPGVLFSLSCRLPMASSAPPSSACGIICGGISRHLLKIWMKNAMSLGMFSLARHRHSSTMKLTAAVRGEYMSSMISYPLRMYSCGSSCHSSASSALKHMMGNTMVNISPSSCGLTTL
mmetsp:Transcript_7271/g.18478  ORF Transcript_7271/g.18478 Transcript_7271/m.18478 type:complete len:327 (-) Transcript_7271:335-1315(-)